MLSGQVVMWGALAWCVVRLLRYAAVGRLYRRRGELPPVGFVRNVMSVAAISCVLSLLLVGTGRPLALAASIAAFALLAFEVVRNLPSSPTGQ